MEVIIILGVILASSYFFGLVAEKLKLPRVTAYILAGILFSKGVFGQFLSVDLTPWSDTFSQVCLGFIAYIIGGEIQPKKIRAHGKTIILATLLSSLLPVLFVYVLFSLASQFLVFPKEIAIILAAISSTTAPAATVAVMEQYKSRGELTDTTLGIVILDDALGIFLFILISSLFFPNGEDDGLFLFAKEIILSVGLGAFLGLSLSKFAKLSPSNDYLLPLLIGLILLSVGVSQKYHFSSLLTCISLGVVANNTNVKDHTRVSLLLPIDHIKELFFIIFFAFSGAHFDLSYFFRGLELIAIYVLARALGKYAGAYAGAKIGITENKKIPSLLGLTLLPQAGVAIGLLIQVVHLPQFIQVKSQLLNIILGSTIIYEFFGPILSKYALEKSGDIVN
jgi:Kef-type K+ transport system membrane component KefB